MKKLFILSLLVFSMALGVQAQGVVTTSMKSVLSGAVDSIQCNGTTPAYLYVNPTNAYKVAGFQPTVTRISAAIGGTIFVQGSFDGTNWYTATYVAGDTLTVANSASQVNKITIAPTNGLPYRYYRLKCTGASSDTMKVRALFTGRQ